jgi:retron-type reverse transcriptase
MKMLEVRIGDERVLRLVARMLKGGVMEDGLTRASEEGYGVKRRLYFL